MKFFSKNYASTQVHTEAQEQESKQGVLFQLSDLAFVVLAILFFAMAIVPNKVLAAQTSLVFELSPSQCVAVRQGNTCYADVNIQWQAQANESYCLFSTGQQFPLKCWDNASQGRWANEVQTKVDLDFVLKRKNSDQVLAQKTLEVAWVYKKNLRRTSSWRMF